jgi:hypothetical protein
VIGLQQRQWRVSALGNLPASGLKRDPGGSEPNPLADSSNLGSMGEPKMRIFS